MAKGLRLRDLSEKLPPDLPKLVPVRIHGNHFLPILPILVKHVLLDHQPGVLELVGVSYPRGPTKQIVAERGYDLSTSLPPRPFLDIGVRTRFAWEIWRARAER